MSADRRIHLGPLIGIVGALLLVVSLFLDWYEDVTAFTVFEVLDLVLLFLGLAMVVHMAGALGAPRLGPNVEPANVLVVAVLALVIVVSQLLNDPPAIAGGDRGQEMGFWLGLAGAALMTAGAILAFARISLAVDVRPRDRGAADDAPRGGADAPAPGAPPGGSDAPTEPLPGDRPERPS